MKSLPAGRKFPERAALIRIYAHTNWRAALNGQQAKAASTFVKLVKTKIARM